MTSGGRRNRPLVHGPWWLLPIVGAVGGLGLLHYSAPAYLLHQGFPLDDAWIHSVYARELARSGLLAYNPGVPATGETSPLWAILLAIFHKLVASGPSVVALTKLFGFALHVGTAGVLGIALQRLEPNRRPIAWAAAGLVAIHPDLIAASVSGMEVPLATFVSALVVLATVCDRALPLFALGAVSFVARPETALIASTFPFLFRARSHFRRGVVLAASAAGGALVAVSLVGLRNNAVSGMMMPATFYAKANRGSLLDIRPQIEGFVRVMDHFALTNSVLAMMALGVAALVLVWSQRSTAFEGAGASMFATGIALCAVSFALIPPTDPAAFYHQRYVLPALVLLIGGLPLIVDGLITRLLPRVATSVTVISLVGLASVLLASMPARAHLLANDARNIDDVQVAFGRALADAPATDVAWVIDAGASRYFGRPYVVDLMALNTPELLRPEARSFLEAHQPRFLDVFPGWSSVVVDSERPLPGRSFEATTRYTVTSHPEMRIHVLVTCEPPGTAGLLNVLPRSQSYPFRCAP